MHTALPFESAIITRPFNFYPPPKTVYNQLWCSAVLYMCPPCGWAETPTVSSALDSCHCRSKKKEKEDCVYDKEPKLERKWSAVNWGSGYDFSPGDHQRKPFKGIAGSFKGWTLRNASIFPRGCLLTVNTLESTSGERTSNRQQPPFEERCYHVEIGPK